MNRHPNEAAVPSDEPELDGELPLHRRGYFGDDGAAALRWERDRHTMVLRLLHVGGLDAVLWLRSQLGDEEIRTFRVRRQGRGIEPRRLRFWGVVPAWRGWKTTLP
jgi:hypothetical protein